MTTKRRLPIDTERVEDMELIIHWQLRHQMAFIFEVESSVVQALLPRGIHATEARPGVGLIFVGFNDYQPTGNFIAGEEQPRFFEMTRCILVQPDLSIRMPIPRFTFFVHRIGSDNAAFVAQEIARLHLPSYHSATLAVEVDDAGTSLRMQDQHGVIQALRNTHPTPLYRNDAFFGQYYAVDRGKLYFGVWNWRGSACVHQRSGDAGGIFEHPFLSGAEGRLPAAAIGPVYQQFFSRPGEVSEQRFYAPRFVRDLEKEQQS